MEGLRIACLYSFSCPELKKAKEKKTILEFAKEPQFEKAPKAREILIKLEPFFFYQFIAHQNKISDPFNERVVRAYWLGNEFLKRVTKEEIKTFTLLKKEITHKKITALKLLELINGKPHHNFETLWLIKKNQFLTERILQEITDCLVRPGKIIKQERNILFLETFRLNLEEKKIVLKKEICKVDQGFLKDPKKEHLVAIHLSRAREKISKETFQNLLKITKEAISFWGNNPIFFVATLDKFKIICYNKVVWKGMIKDEEKEDSGVLLQPSGRIS